MPIQVAFASFESSGATDHETLLSWVNENGEKFSAFLQSLDEDTVEKWAKYFTADEQTGELVLAEGAASILEDIDTQFTQFLTNRVLH
jgi:hypothetical protein